MSTALAPVGAGSVVRDERSALMPVFTGQQMTVAFGAYRELQRALDAAMPDQIMDIRGRMFRKKGYWRAIATAFNLNVSCVREESDDYGWRVVYRAETPSGRFAEGDGACENEEKSEGQDTEHNVRSHAHTRAFNRAVSNLVGFGEVSAEEVGGRGSRRATAAPPATVIDTTTGREVPADQKPEPPEGYHYIHNYGLSGEWHEFTILNLDAQGGAMKFSTKTRVGQVVGEAFREGVPIRIDDATPKKNGKGEAYINKVTVWKPTPTQAALDAEIAAQDMATAASEIL